MSCCKKFFKAKYLLILAIVVLIVVATLSLTLRQAQKTLAISSEPVTLAEDFLTKRDGSNDVDSLALWFKGDQNWLLATAKATHKILVYDAANGKDIKEFGKKGNKKGDFLRPNGIAVKKDFLFIVERDNHRVQIMTLPDFKSIGFIGEKDLQKPYGLTLYKVKPDKYMLYVTDSYDSKDIKDLDKRVHQYKVTIKNNEISSKEIRTFGSDKNGFLKAVESITADKKNERLFICDESKERKDIKIYTLDGNFTGNYLGKGLFKGEPEGIALYKTEDKNGYLITTDQSYRENIFHIFNRKTLDHLGSFKGKVVLNTDGITVTSKSFDQFRKGAFYAVHDDGNVAAFSWEKISQALALG